MKKVSVLLASKVLDVSPQFIRIGLQREKLPFGIAVLMNKRWVYHISPNLLSEYVGNSDWLKEYEKEEVNEDVRYANSNQNEA